ncbi:hypothetical protein ACFLYH_01460 [Candidatus Dependentiae bacterium]
MKAKKLAIFFTLCFFLNSVLFSLKAMESKTEKTQQNPTTIDNLNLCLKNHLYGRLKEILYKQLEKDKSGKLLNWVKDNAKNNALPFFWYMISRNFYYKIITRQCANSTSDIDNFFRAMVICLIRIYQDIVCFKNIDSSLDFNDKYEIFRNKFIYWRNKNFKKQTSYKSYNVILGQVKAFFYRTTKNKKTKFKYNLSSPVWVTTPKTSKISWSIDYDKVNPEIKIIGSEEYNIKKFKQNRRTAFDKIFKIMNEISKSEKSELEKWNELFNIDITKI